jgi:uracil-DNA glycosylase
MPAKAGIQSKKVLFFVMSKYHLDQMGIQAWEKQASTPHSSSVNPKNHSSDLDWEELEARVAACTACPLHLSRTQTVFGVGNKKAELMVIGEAPGATEDKMGLPFVGRAGQLLDSMLFAIGLDREKVYIANVLKSRPPNNRDPLPEEVAACKPFLLRQIELVQPRLILAVGRVAAQMLLQTDEPMSKLRGPLLSFQNIPLMVTYHPAYLLRSPREKRKGLDDMLRVVQFLADKH